MLLRSGFCSRAATFARHLIRPRPTLGNLSPYSTAAPSTSGSHDGHDGAHGGSVRTGFLTDVEGNLEFFVRSVEFSSVLKLTSRSAAGLELDFADDQGKFVYGGDVCDHGPGDIRIARALVDLKHRHPDRVFLLAGNRDINKLRFSSELWPRIDSAQENFDRINSCNASETRPETHENAADFLRTMLSRTMGSPNAFERRRQELSELGEAKKSGSHNPRNSEVGSQNDNNKLKNIDYEDLSKGDQKEMSNNRPFEASDDDVVASFGDSVRPGGYMIEYLEAAQLAVLLGDTLFVHGAVPERGLGFVPTSRTGGFVVSEARDWINKLNSFYREQLAIWRQDPLHHAPNKNGDLVMDYSRPGGVEGRGVVYNDWLESDDTLPEPISDKVAEFLTKSGIRRVVSGHRPHGVTPTVIRRDSDPNLTVITADTSYSDPDAEDNRGEVIYEVLIEEEDTYIRGILKDGTPYSFHVSDYPELGHRVANGGHAKAVVPEGLLVCHSRGPGTFSSELDYEVTSSSSPSSYST